MARSRQAKSAAKPQRGGDGVQSVERALELLEALAEPGEAKGVSELARATGLPVATIHRLLATMVARGYVRQDTGSHKYTLGSHLIRLGEAASRDFAQFARPYLTELMEASGETANLAMFEDGQVAYVAQVASRHHRVRMFTEVGRRVNPHTSGVGKVVLAFCPRPEVEALLARTGLPRAHAADHHRPGPVPGRAGQGRQPGLRHRQRRGGGRRALPGRPGVRRWWFGGRDVGLGSRRKAAGPRHRACPPGDAADLGRPQRRVPHRRQRVAAIKG